MRMKRILPLLYIILAAILLEMTVFAASFWKTLGNDTGIRDLKTEYIYGQVDMQKMHEVPADWSEGEIYTDDAGFTHLTSGSLLIRLSGLACKVEQLGLNLSLPENRQAKVSVFMRDEGNAYTYQLIKERVIWEWMEESKEFLVYPYGEVQDIFIYLQSETEGQELVYQLDGVEVNGTMEFSFSVSRVLIVCLILLIIWGLGSKSGLQKTVFWPEECNRTQRMKRMIAIAVCGLILTVLSAMAVLANPVCRKNLGLHHAQYQELAAALSRGETAVGMADERLMQVENPYDTIYLQANQIPYQADYAYRDGKYYVYFGIVPELLCYLPYYLLTGRDLPNYAAFLLFCTGFLISCAGLVYELMRRYFKNVPFYLYPVCIFMLGFGYPLFYMQLRPDLYHVPIAASCMFTAMALWFVLAGTGKDRMQPYLWGAGALCMALNAGCRPQFLLFSVLLIPLCVPDLWNQIKKKQMKTLIAMAMPYLAVAAGIMYYNAVRFGSPFDFGATYSMTSNDMTHRGFNLSRIVYSAWYYLFEPPHLEGVFPYIQSAVIETDYAGRLVSESCFGGIFACSMLYWPIAAFGCGKGRLQKKRLTSFTGLSILSSLVICAADATGAGVLQRYMADQMPGFALAAVVLLLSIAEWAEEKGIYQYFAGWLRIALLLHMAFLVLILINADSSVNIAKGNTRLYSAIWSLLQF